MRIRSTLLAVAAVAGTVVAGTLPADAAGSGYVALGDSYSAGTGAGGYIHAGCVRSAYAYPKLWANAHPGTSLSFPACARATTDDVLANQLGSLGSSTTLVTITIGGNDIGFAGLMTTCVTGSDQACVDKVEESGRKTETELPPKLDRTYSAIRSRAPGAKVVVLGYPRLFVSGTAWCGMSLAKRDALNVGAGTLADVIESRAQAAGFTYEDVRDDFDGHEVCTSSPWMNGFKPFNVVESYHPNRTGQDGGYYRALAGQTA